MNTRLAPPSVLLAFTLLGTSPAFAQGPSLPEGTIQMPPAAHLWVDAPPMLPAGTKMLILEGHPKQEGMFTMRLRVPADSRLDVHWHPRDERVTIFSGLVRVGFGDTWDEATMAEFGPGSFYLNPPKSRHYVWCVEDTEMQLTGMGPWEVHFEGE